MQADGKKSGEDEMKEGGRRRRKGGRKYFWGILAEWSHAERQENLAAVAFFYSCIRVIILDLKRCFSFCSYGS